MLFLKGGVGIQRTKGVLGIQNVTAEMKKKISIECLEDKGYVAKRQNDRNREKIIKRAPKGKKQKTEGKGFFK